MLQIVLYLHILAACSWVGGSVLLFALGILIRDKHKQSSVYGVIGPLYGYFESFWILVLLGSGLWLLDYYGVMHLIGKSSTELEYALSAKSAAVLLLSVATVIHLIVAFRTHGKSRTKLQTLLSRGGSMSIFILNFVILWYAMSIRSILH